MGNAEVGITVKARDQASGVVKEVEKSVTSLGQARSAAGAQIGNLFAGLAVGAAVTGIVSAGVELVKLGAGAQRVEDGFRNLARQAGVSANDMLSKLRSASQGTISDTDLMLTANKAMMLGVATSADQLASLLQAAASRGAALGVSTAQAFSDIVTGIGRMSPEILDNLGIVTGGVAAFDRYAASLGKTAAQLSDVEKKQMLVNAVLAQGGPVLNDAQAKVDRFTISLQNLREAFAKAAVANLNDIKVPNLAERITEVINDSRRIQEVQRAGGTFTREQIDQLMALGDQYMANGISAANYRLNIESLIGAKEAAIVKSEQLANTLAGVGNFMAQVIAQSGAMAAGLNTIANSAINAADKARAFGIAIKGIAAGGQQELFGIAESYAAKSGVGAKQALAAFNDWNAGLQATINNARAEGATLEEINLLRADYIGGIRDSITESNRATTATNTYSDALSGLKSSIDSVISSSVSGTKSLVDFASKGMVGGFDPNGPAQAFGRMWDVAVNGFNSQWLEPLRQQGLIPPEVIAAGEGALKQFAEGKAKAFQAGTDLGMLDQGKIVEQVKAQIQAQGELERVRQEVLAKVMAGGASKAQATQALDQVLGPEGGSQGTTSAGQFKSGFTSGLAGFGGQISVTLQAEMKANETAIGKAGETAARAWGGVFLTYVGDNVPVALIDLLVNLVTPGVMAKFNAQKERSGAVE